jgi:hypothetical protein
MTLVCQLSKCGRDNVETERRTLRLDRNNEDKPFGDDAPSEATAGYDLCVSRKQGFTFQKFENGYQTLFVAP